VIDRNAVLDIPSILVVYPELAASTVRRWAHEGRLEQRGTDGRGRRLYRLGDVADIVMTRRDDAASLTLEQTP
jgi:hypothetical protein